jgi:hypothetical protein
VGSGIEFAGGGVVDHELVDFGPEKNTVPAKIFSPVENPQLAILCTLVVLSIVLQCR